MSADTLYEFEGPIEEAIAALFANSELAAIHLNSDPKFQETRPRVEILFSVGPAKKSYHIVRGVQRNATWTGTLTLALITGSDEAGKSTHRAYKARIRSIMEVARYTLNGLKAGGTPYLSCIKIQNIVDGGSSPTPKPQDGYQKSTMIYAVDFGIDSAAWAELDIQ